MDARWERWYAGPGPLLLILVAGIALFCTNLGVYDLWPADEPRFGEVPREMLLSGNYLAPTVNGEPYLEKPPLLFWLIAAASIPVGDVTEFTARMPSAIAALITLIFTFLLARRLYGPRVALWAGLVLVASLRFWWQARTVQIDMLLTACLTVCLYALWRWEEERRGKWLLLLYGAMAAGMLAKGPPALVFPLLFIVAFYWRQPASRRATHWVWGALFAIAVVSLWYLPARLAVADSATQALESGVGENLLRNTIGRFFLGISKAQPPWYYLTTLPADWMPWTLFAPWLLVYTWRRRRESKMMRFLLCWIVPAFIFFTISIGKRGIYILPLFPAMAIVIALGLLQFAQRDDPRWHRRIALIWGCLLLLVAIVLVLPHLITIPFEGQVLHLEPTSGVLFLVALFSTMGLTVLLRAGRLEGILLPRIIATQTLLALALVPPLVFPIVNEFKSARFITEPVRELVRAGAEFRLYSLGFSREEYIFYSRKFHEPVLNAIIGEAEIPPAELLSTALLQKEARDIIKDAVEDLPLADIEAVSDAERQALRASIEHALATEQPDDVEKLRAIEDGIVAELDAFARRFQGGGPALMFVQDEDWRWLVALFTEVPEYQVVQHRHVGRREVLLLANPAGAELLAAQAPQLNPAS